MDSVIGLDVVTGKPIVYQIVRCELCIACHAWPLPSQEALIHFYTNVFYQRDKPEYVARYEQDRTWWEDAVHGPILQQCQQYLFREERGGGIVRFLDIGAGPGIALDVAHKRFGWDTWGLEPNGVLCETSQVRGHHMIQNILGSPEICGLHMGIDVVYAYEVLEHQICPDDFLLSAYDLLKPGGLIVVTVPNEYNPLQLTACTMYAMPPWWLAPPQHLFYWTPKTLQLCLRRCGFQLLDMRGTYPLEHFLLDGMPYVGNDLVGRECHRQRMAAELRDVHAGTWLEREACYRENLGACRTGREIVALARKCL